MARARAMAKEKARAWLGPGQYRVSVRAMAWVRVRAI